LPTLGVLTAKLKLPQTGKVINIEIYVTILGIDACRRLNMLRSGEENICEHAYPLRYEIETKQSFGRRSKKKSLRQSLHTTVVVTLLVVVKQQNDIRICIDPTPLSTKNTKQVQTIAFIALKITK